jgi:hypothetical protein
VPTTAPSVLTLAIGAPPHWAPRARMVIAVLLPAGVIVLAALPLGP